MLKGSHVNLKMLIVGVERSDTSEEEKKCSAVHAMAINILAKLSPRNLPNSSMSSIL